MLEDISIYYRDICNDFIIFHSLLKNPQHVAEVLAELFKGYCAPFPSNPGSYVAFAADEHGTLVEVYPLGTEMIPGEDQEPIKYRQNDSSQFIATHAAISVPLESITN